MTLYRCSCGKYTTYGLSCSTCMRNFDGSILSEEEVAAIDIDDYIAKENKDD